VLEGVAVRKQFRRKKYSVGMQEVLFGLQLDRKWLEAFCRAYYITRLAGL
jgi:hypothetical protein